MADDELVKYCIETEHAARLVWNAAVNSCAKIINDRKYEYTDLVGMTELIN